MALLQISEPGQAPNPHQRRIAVGIDLGTTHSLVAAVRHGVAECLPDGEGRVILPSVVRYLAGGGRDIGYPAQAAQSSDPENAIASVKRFMGRSLADVVGADKLPYRFADHAGMLGVLTVAGEKSPVEVSADILATLRYRAEDTFNDDLYGAVITVPAYFDDAQRQATKDAAQLAGIKVLRLINEPTAAAIAYGLDNASEGVYAIYDLGGGTFDISILRLTQGVFEVVATGGDSALGGDDYDHALADWVQLQTGAVAVTAADKSALKVAARACKEALTATNMVALCVDLTGANIHFDVEKSTLRPCHPAHLTARTLRRCARLCVMHDLTVQDVKGVVMVGGSTRMPQVQRSGG
jgi:molecular chaperone HscA